MGRRSQRNRLVGTTVAVAIFLIMSAFIGNFLLAKNASAGGLDVEWKVPLPTGYAQLSTAPDGSIIVREAGGSLRDIDRTGLVKWEYNASGCLEMSLGSDGSVYLLDRDTAGNYSIVCLLGNGTPSWRFDTSETLRDLQVGSDGRIYFIENPGEMSILVCLQKDGSLAWQTMPDGGDLSDSPVAIFEDGTVLAKSLVHSWDTSHGFPDWVVSDIHLTGISENGSVQWKTDFLASAGNSINSVGPLPTGNATLEVIFFVNGTQTAIGLNCDGSVNWTCKNDHDAFPGTIGPGNVVYYVENYEDQPWGYPTHPVDRISCWNTSSGQLRWQMVQNGTAQGPMAMSNDSSSFLIDGELVTFASNGSVASRTTYPDNTDLGTLLDRDGTGGKLYTADSTLSMTDGNGSLVWQFPVGSPVKAGSIGQDGRIIVMTDDYAISIHRPVLTTTMNYFVVLLAIDLFVSLMATVRIVDMMWPQAKSKVQ